MIYLWCERLCPQAVSPEYFTASGNTYTFLSSSSAYSSFEALSGIVTSDAMTIISTSTYQNRVQTIFLNSEEIWHHINRKVKINIYIGEVVYRQMCSHIQYCKYFVLYKVVFALYVLCCLHALTPLQNGSLKYNNNNT